MVDIVLCPKGVCVRPDRYRIGKSKVQFTMPTQITVSKGKGSRRRAWINEDFNI